MRSVRSMSNPKILRPLDGFTWYTHFPRHERSFLRGASTTESRISNQPRAKYNVTKQSEKKKVYGGAGYRRF